jgi:hypothetical protein
MCLSFIIAAGPRQRSNSQVRTHDNILLSQIQDSPNLEDQVPVFMSLRNSVARLYPQALGFLNSILFSNMEYTSASQPF